MIQQTPTDDLDVATARLDQAHALASLTHGDCFETFANRPDEIQHNTLWLLGSLIGEARDALQRLQARQA